MTYKWVIYCVTHNINDPDSIPTIVRNNSLHLYRSVSESELISVRPVPTVKSYQIFVSTNLFQNNFLRWSRLIIKPEKM